MNDEMLILPGGIVKATDDEGRFGGYAVRFTGPMDVDLQGDFFTPSTELDLEDRQSLPLYFSHGKDPVLQDRKLGKVSFKTDDVGVWVSGQLDQHDRWLKKIFELIKEGVMGYSTGAIGHLVRRAERQGLAGKVYELLRWGVGEVSLCVNPAEPRNAAIALKSFQTPSLKEMVRLSKLTDVERRREQTAKLREQSRALVERARGLLDPSAPTVSTWAEAQTKLRGRHEENVEERRTIQLTVAKAREEFKKVEELKAEYERLCKEQERINARLNPRFAPGAMPRWATRHWQCNKK